MVGVKVHCLRDIHTVVVYRVFHHSEHISFPLFQKKMLGHQSVTETLAYNKPNVVVHSIETSIPDDRISISMDEGCHTTRKPTTVLGY